MSRAERDEWRPGVAQFALTRASTWFELQVAFEAWRTAVRHAGETSPELVPSWVYAAAYGICDAVDAGTAHRLIASVLVTAAGAVKSEAAEFARCLGAAKAICAERQVSAPTKLALAMMLDMLSQRIGPDKAAGAVANLGSKLDGDDKAALLQLLFALGP
jgi:hypothetical protein